MSKRLEQMSELYEQARRGIAPFFIGFDAFFEDATNMIHNATGYPPYNIVRTKNGTSVEVALAGLSINDIEVFMEKTTLHVKYVKPQEESDLETGKQYAHKGIASRSFDFTLTVAEGVYVKDASMSNGLLRLELYKEIPENTRKVISVTQL